jgi:DNA invertase Pin-like site-specific DNA recombinase
MRIGYARVSTDDPTLDLQRDALKRAKCRHTYEEQASGKNTARPELKACLKALRTGDTLVVWRLDRLGRSLRDLIRERTLAGLKAARARGRHGGRPKKLSPKELKKIRTLLRSNEVPVQDIAAQFKVNRSTLYRNMAASAA